MPAVPTDGEAEALCVLLRSEEIPCFHNPTDVNVEGGGFFSGQPIGDDGRWHSDGAGELVPYCAGCAEREFGPRQ